MMQEGWVVQSDLAVVIISIVGFIPVVAIRFYILIIIVSDYVDD